MNARKLGIICALLAAMPNLVGCESSRSQDYQFEKQVKRAQECRQLRDKLLGDQPLTAERGEEIANNMKRAGCTARLPSADADVPPRLGRVLINAQIGGPLLGTNRKNVRSF
jgi:hypothetical protein